jgi:hypothetical protein
MGWLSTGASSGLIIRVSVLSTSFREAIGSEPTDIAAVIERALLINDAATRNTPPPVSSVRRAISPRISASQGSKWDQLDGGKDVPFAVDIPQVLVSLEGSTPSVEDKSDPSSMDIRNQSQTLPTYMDIGDNTVASLHTPAPIAWEFLRDYASSTAALPPFNPFPCHPHPSIYHQTASYDRLHPSAQSSEMRTRASSSQSSHLRSASPRHFPTPPPSRPALNTLHNILKLKRQINRSSSSATPSAASLSQSCSSRRLYPAPSEPPVQTPLKRSAESSADVVAAALNESARLSQEWSSRASASSTPLRPYKRHRPLTATLLRGNRENTVPRNEPRHRERDDSLSPKRPSSPSIAALGLTGSVLGSPLTELTPSVSGDELDFSYPPSPKPRVSDLVSHPASGEEPKEPPRPVELTEPVRAASLSSPKLPSPEELAAMQSAALQFLQRYGQTFDTDQRALAEAYAPHAMFSCPSRGLRTQGRESILDALAQLGHGVLCSERTVAYDVFSVPSIGILLVVLGTMIGAQGDGDKNVGYTMNFVLQPGDHEDRSVLSFLLSLPPALIYFFFRLGTGHWPLVAAMHQIILRES